MRVHRRIVADPEILGGKPILENTRVSVAHILGLLGNGMSVEQVVESYPIDPGATGRTRVCVCASGEEGTEFRMRPTARVQ